VLKPFMTVPHACTQNNEASLKNKMTILIFGVKDTRAFVNTVFLKDLKAILIRNLDFSI
jgi:hypothetical protein